MVNYNCIRCGYSSSRKSDMRLHLNRKNKCNPILRDINIDDYRQDILSKRDFTKTTNCSILLHSAPPMLHSAPFCSRFECQYCERKYTYKRNLIKHLHTCKSKIEQEEADEKTYVLVDTLNQQIEEQKKQIEIQDKRIDTLEHTNPQILNNTNNVQININIDKNRLNYDNTNYNIINDQDIRNSLNHAGRCIQEIIPRTHFNKQHPENQNIYISCLKSAVAMMFEGERWNAHMWEDVAERFIDDNTVTLQEWVDANDDQYPILAEKFKVFIKKKTEDDKFITKLKREIKIILYNNRKIIHSDAMINQLQSL